VDVERVAIAAELAGGAGADVDGERGHGVRKKPSM